MKKDSSFFLVVIDISVICVNSEHRSYSLYLFQVLEQES